MERGVYDESVLDDMVTHVEAALDGIEEFPPALAGELLDEVARVVAGQQQVLSGMMADLPAASRLAVEQILGHALAQVTRIDAMRWAMDQYETGTPPEGELTAVPTGTVEPGQILSATVTSTSMPDSEETPTPTSTRLSGGTEPGEATSAPPTATFEPSPTSLVSATETPSPTPAEGKPTKATPPGQTKTPEPPGHFTDTPEP